MPCDPAPPDRIRLSSDGHGLQEGRSASDLLRFCLLLDCGSFRQSVPGLAGVWLQAHPSGTGTASVRNVPEKSTGLRIIAFRERPGGLSSEAVKAGFRPRSKPYYRQKQTAGCRLRRLPFAIVPSDEDGMTAWTIGLFEESRPRAGFQEP
jgi:hypothetical protein